MEPIHESDRSGDRDAGGLTTLRWLVFVYLFLLLFEGALRKWVFPGWSNWLLVARDPVVILIYLVAMSKGLVVLNRWLTWTGLVVAASFLVSVAEGHPLLIALYGLRTNLLHLPLIFLLPRILTVPDAWRIGRLFVLLRSLWRCWRRCNFCLPVSPG